jgi:hypothetical protein
LGLGVLSAGGCVVAAAGAGAAAGIHITSQGAEAHAAAGIVPTASAVQQTFREMGIRQTAESTEKSGAQREFKGEVDDLDITVKLETHERGTRIDVSARRSLASWDTGYAERVLGRILQLAG